METFAFPVLEGERVDTVESDAEHVQAAIDAACAAGHEEGLAAGLAEVRAQLEPARTALLAAAAALERTVEEIVPQAERRAVELALALAEKVLATSLDADPELIVRVVTGALRRAVHHGPVAIAVNPADVELVRSSLAEVAGELGSLPQLDVVGERRIARGGCVVRTKEGEIDARLDTQLARAAEILRER
ncbi:MAG TPA: FliH/SctL family protein [Gaiellaceae bacterium]|nr:FliH/SctL family protein [Gaiellaceae bacterium]